MNGGDAMGVGTFQVTSADTHGNGLRRRAGSRAVARLRAVASVSFGTAAIGACAWLYGEWIVDDAGITFAYARHVAQGLGPVIQPGDTPVEGYSDPTWMLLLAAGRAAGVFDRGRLLGVPDYVLFPKALALLCCAGLLCGCYAGAARMTARPWWVTVVVGLGLAAIPSFVIWCFSGLENALYACLVVVLAVLLVRAVVAGRLLTYRVAVLTGLLAALATLTRPDGLVYAAAYPLVALLLAPRGRPAATRARMSAASTAVFVGPVGGYVAWRHAEFGRWVPNTAVAKGQGLPGLASLLKPTALADYLGFGATVAMVVVVAVALARPGPGRRALAALLVPLGLALSAYAVLARDWMPQYRFATPVWALGMLAGALAGTMVLSRIRRHRRHGLLVSALVIALAATLVPSGMSFAADVEQFRAHPTMPLCGVAGRFGRVFNGYADLLGLPRASLLLPDLGGSSLSSRLHLIDMAGLVTPRIANFVHDGDPAALRDYVFEDLRPTFIHSRPPWDGANGLVFDPRLQRHYYRIYRPVAPEPQPWGDWVRKSAVSGPAELAALRAYARTVTTHIVGHIWVTPLAACGPTLRPGQTPESRHQPQPRDLPIGQGY
jgi:hypothetical protein